MKVHVNGVFFGISERLVKSDLWKMCALNCGGTSRGCSGQTIWHQWYRKVKGLNDRPCGNAENAESAESAESAENAENAALPRAAKLRHKKA
jgi:hypothetical protein